MRPQGYAYLAFTQGARGRSLPLEIQSATNLDLNAYAYQDEDGAVYFTLINKSYGDTAQSAEIKINLPKGMANGVWSRMDLVQKDHDIAAKNGVLLGDAQISADGLWSGRWSKLDASGDTHLNLPAASTALLRFAPGK